MLDEELTCSSNVGHLLDSYPAMALDKLVPAYAVEIAESLRKHFPGRVWLIGGEASNHVQGRPLGDRKDTDIAVEGASLGMLRAALSGLTSSINTFGGVKIHRDSSKTVDIFNPPSMAQYLSECPFPHQAVAVNLTTGCVLATREYHADPSRKTRVPRLAVTAESGAS